jgi:hypothetical protein
VKRIQGSDRGWERLRRSREHDRRHLDQIDTDEQRLHLIGMRTTQASSSNKWARVTELSM